MRTLIYALIYPIALVVGAVVIVSTTLFLLAAI